MGSGRVQVGSRKNLPPTSDPRSVRAVYYRRHNLSQSELSRAVNLIKNGEKHAKVEGIIQRSAPSTRMAASRSYAKLERRTNGSKPQMRTYLKMRLLAVKTMVDLFYRQGLRVQVRTLDGEVLLEVGND